MAEPKLFLSSAFHVFYLPRAKQRKVHPYTELLHYNENGVREREENFLSQGYLTR